MANTQTPSDVVAGRVRDVRTKRKLTVAGLAARCAALGAPDLTAQALYKLEGRRPGKLRPRPVTVDELLALAAALNVAPVHLLVPTDDFDESYRLTAEVSVSASSARAWIRGVLPLLPGDDGREYWSEVPRDEFYMPAHWSGDGEVMIPAVQQGPRRPRKEGS